MSKNVTSASIVAGLLFLWLISGLWIEPAADPEAVLIGESVTATQTPQPTLSRVRIELKQSEARTQSVVLRGRTEAKRNVEVTAEISGQVVSRSVERGQQVRRGQLLCEIAIDDRSVAVEEAQAAWSKLKLKTRAVWSLRPAACYLRWLSLLLRRGARRLRPILSARC